ncbi:hypothetical protein ACL02T_20345 [Pseudonocardia sp. RS010]|uniref:hypothetical protein n=1 Tax=Pseudonocardia sp. RS010 TaxID=3385979 RepID=UPI0039A2E2CA
MPIQDLFSADFKILGSAKVSISSATTSNFDFGTPNDLDLASLSNYEPGDKVLVVFVASTSGSTDIVSFSVQDAPDSAGSIGTPATAVTDGTLTGGTGDQYAKTAVRLQPGRPWLRCRVTSNGASDTFVAQCVVLALPRA